MPNHPSFVTCARCNTVQWFTLEYLNHSGQRAARCRRCLGSDWRDANVFPTLRERFYLLRMFVWQQWFVNRAGTEGADPYWYFKPHMVLKVVYHGLTVMRAYNHIEPEGDNECPRNIEALRAELSGRDADTDGGVPDSNGVLLGFGRDSV